eukprot:8692767-Alexandrium_andersonii.AAC.1
MPPRRMLFNGACYSGILSAFGFGSLSSLVPALQGQTFNDSVWHQLRTLLFRSFQPYRVFPQEKSCVVLIQ